MKRVFALPNRLSLIVLGVLSVITTVLLFVFEDDEGTTWEPDVILSVGGLYSTVIFTALFVAYFSALVIARLFSKG